MWKLKPCITSSEIIFASKKGQGNLISTRFYWIYKTALNGEKWEKTEKTARNLSLNISEMLYFSMFQLFETYVKKKL